MRKDLALFPYGDGLPQPAAPSLTDDRDFLLYGERYRSLPFERVLEAVRSKSVVQELTRQGCNSTSSLIEVGVGLSGIAMHFPGCSATAVDPMAWALAGWLEACRDSGVSSNSFCGTLAEYFHSSAREKNFGFAVMSSVLHEVPDPAEALSQVKDLLRTSGVLCVVVPNRLSVHRLIGAGLGLTEGVHARTETEISMGQHAAHDTGSLSRLLRHSGFEVLNMSTILLKPLSNAQLAAAQDSGSLGEDRLAMLEELVDLVPDWGAEIVATARLR